MRCGRVANCRAVRVGGGGRGPCSWCMLGSAITVARTVSLHVCGATVGGATPVGRGRGNSGRGNTGGGGDPQVAIRHVVGVRVKREKPCEASGSHRVRGEGGPHVGECGGCDAAVSCAASPALSVLVCGQLHARRLWSHGVAMARMKSRRQQVGWVWVGQVTQVFAQLV